MIKPVAKAYAVGNNSLLAYINLSASNNKKVNKLINKVAMSDNFTGVSAVAHNNLYIAANTVTGTPLSKLHIPVINADATFKITSSSTYTGTGFIANRGVQFVNNTKGAVLSTTGKVYNCTASGPGYTFGDISHVSSAYTAISTDGTGLYAMNQTSGNVNIYKTTSGTWATLTAHGGTLSGVTGYNISQNNNILYVAGNSGLISTIGYPTSSSWADNSLKTAPLPLRDIYAVPTTGGSTTNTAYAVGDDGTIIKTTNGGTSWQTLGSGTYERLYAASFRNTTDGVIVGAKGTTLQSSSSSIAVINSGTAKHLFDITYNGSTYFVAGESHTLLKSTDGGTTYNPLVVPGITAETFNGISSTTNTFVVFGQAGYNLRNYMGSWYYTYKQPYALTSLDINKRNNAGMIVGTNGTTIYTTDRGYTWQFNKPVISSGIPISFTGIALWDANNIYTTGLNNKAAKFIKLQDPNSSGGSIYASSSGVDWKDVQINGEGKGYLAGSNSTYAYFKAADPAAAIIGSNTGAPSSYSVNSISMNYDEVFFACDNNRFFKANIYTLAITNLSGDLPSGSNDLLHYVAYDKLNGILLGKNGQITLVRDNNGQMAFDNKTSANNNGNAVTHNLQAMAYINRSHVVFAGAGGHIKNLEVDKAYTSFFWYDRLGRMVVSQNARQYNKATPAYSYTLYDPLGRIKQVGEIAQGNPIQKQFINGQLSDGLFTTWIAASGPSARTEVTETWYDFQFTNVSTIAQYNLRKRVASVTYENVFDKDSTTYGSATHYSYDIHGNVNHMAQEIREAKLLSTGLNIKHITYEYDLVSGKVNKVCYNAGSKDQYYHKYEYDADNRITHTYTSRNDIWYDNDAKYGYYNHGPLARTELGDIKVQGMDYAYTLHGWLKGVNSNTLQSNRDMGKDGNVGSTRQFTARDAMGYTLGYYEDNTGTGTFDGDYISIKTFSTANNFEAAKTSSDMMAARKNLYNGNIGHMVVALPQFVETNGIRSMEPSVRGGAYKYDQLNRLVEARSYFNINIASNTWSGGGGTPVDYYENFKYDAMGNIQHVNRWGNGGVQMDNMDYKYNTNTAGHLVSNKLYAVNDGIAGSNFADDIDNQATFNNTTYNVNYKNNYAYDELGNLKKDSAEDIANIEWTVYGKIRKVTRYAASTKPDMEYIYDAGGNRICKITKPKPLNCNTYKYYYYLRDAQGNEMANYQLDMVTNCSTVSKLYVTEHQLYGSSRLGIDTRRTLLYNNGVNLSRDTLAITQRELGNKQYELSNHLGNVLVTVLDKKVGKVAPGGGTTITHFDPDIKTITDYYAFGSPMPGRQGIQQCSTVTVTTNSTIDVANNDFEDGSTGNFTTGNGSTMYTVTTAAPDNTLLHIENYNAGRVMVTYPFPVFVNNGTYTISVDIKDFYSTNGDYMIGVTGAATVAYTTYTNTGVITIFFIPSYDGTAELEISEIGGNIYAINDYINIDDFKITYDVTTTNTNTVCGILDKGYRYGFNGKEKDNEITVDEGSYDFGARIYDSRLGRWLSLDPLMKEKAFLTPYRGMANNPILYMDPDGRDEFISVTIVDKRTGKIEVKNPIKISENFHEVLVQTLNSNGTDWTNSYSYYNTYTQIVCTIDENGLMTMEVTGTVDGTVAAYKRTPMTRLIPHCWLLDGDWEGNGDKPRNGGVKLTSADGGVSPTKTEALNLTSSKNIDPLMSVLPVTLAAKIAKNAEMVDQFKNICEKIKEISDNNILEKKKKDAVEAGACEATLCNNQNCTLSVSKYVIEAYIKKNKTGEIPTHSYINPKGEQGHGAGDTIVVPCED